MSEIPDEAAIVDVGRCIGCGHGPAGSLEHLFPQALGARKTSTTIYCDGCNHRLGQEVDAPFTAAFEFITTQLDVKRPRGRAPTLRRTTVDGQRIYVAAGGHPTAADPSVRVEEGEGGRKSFRISVPADRPQLLEHMLAKAAKDLGVPRSALNIENTTLTATTAGVVETMIPVGSAAQLRGAAKIALGFLASMIGTDVLAPAFARLRNAVANSYSLGEVAWASPAISEVDCDGIPGSDGAQHRVFIFSEGDELWAHVVVYAAFGYSVLLAEQKDPRFAVPYLWVHNPITGESGQAAAGGMRVPSLIRVSVAPDQAHVDALARISQIRMRDLAWDRIIEEELILFGARLGENVEISENDINELCRRLAERMYAASHVGRELSLEMPVADRTKLDAIAAELRRLAASKPR